MLSKWIHEKNKTSYIAIALILLSFGTLSVLLGSSKILDILFRENSWLHFTKGVFCGFSMTLIVIAMIISIKALNFIKHKE